MSANDPTRTSSPVHLDVCIDARLGFSDHPPLKFVALMIGHHFAISAFWKAASASGVCRSRGKISNPSYWPTAVIGTHSLNDAESRRVVGLYWLWADFINADP
jgi:hypothetical protein